MVTQRSAVSCLVNYEEFLKTGCNSSSQTIKMAECDHSGLLSSENEEFVGKVKQFLEARCGSVCGTKTI